MATNYPTGYDTAVTVPATLDGTPLHSAMHDNDRDAIVAIEQAVGTSPGGPFGSVAGHLSALLAGGALATIAYRPSGDTDASVVAGGNIWVTLGTVTVPSWAASYIMIMTASNLFSITAASDYALKARVSGTGVVSMNRARLAWPATGDRRGVSWVTSGALTGTGSQSVAVHAERVAGTGQARADANAEFSALILFRT